MNGSVNEYISIIMAIGQNQCPQFHSYLTFAICVTIKGESYFIHFLVCMRIRSGLKTCCHCGHKQQKLYWSKLCAGQRLINLATSGNANIFGWMSV